MRDSEQELVEVEAKAAKLKSQCEHGQLDATDITVKVGMFYETVERLTDNSERASRHHTAILCVTLGASRLPIALPRA